MKRRSPIHAYKRLLADDHDWDYAYLIALEKKKLQRMHDYIEQEGHFEGKELVVRDIAICIRLIDIFMENDAVHNTWLHQSFSGDMRFRKLEDGNYELDDTNRKPIADYPVYVNVRNERRFFRATPIKDAIEREQSDVYINSAEREHARPKVKNAQSEGDRDKVILSTVSLRQQKALHLYHLIREYKLLTWWE